ncbi:branched-chain amino acid transport system permease protein [Rhodoligotrophos appendicifer]|uniref:branched-chain amino acid ABC transporter permease n=1 Tax=Rhodoligotrophos appendicifer TaxID=987056 RepID=UPI0014796C62|nr:branched-chain amino acid ABC transporter permease [Rhodoligotrophos appendicifer]
MTSYILGILVTLSIYGLLAISLDLLIGYTGLFTIVHGGLFGVGAYAAAVAALSFGVGFWEGALVGLIAGGALSLLIAIPSLRVSGHYLVLASFGVQEVLSSLYLNLNVTGGAGGLRGVPRPELFGLQIDTNGEYLVLYVFLLVIAFLFLLRLTGSSFGLLLKAVREDELVPQALGKNIVALKIKTFAVSGALAGLAGAMYAHYITFVSPEAFDVHASIFILSMVLIGGMGTLWGPLLGAAVLVIVPELLRFLPVSSSDLGPLRQIIYGVILVGFCFLRPRGLVGGRGGAE